MSPWREPPIVKLGKFAGRKIRNATQAASERRTGGPDAPLPVDQWIQAPGLVFGMPFGWVPMSEDAVLNTMLQDPQQIRPAAALIFQQETNAFHTLIVKPTLHRVTESEFRSLTSAIAQKWAEDNAPARLVSGPVKLAVGGAPAVMFRASEIMDGAPYGLGHAVEAMTETVQTCRRGTTYMLSLVGPAEQHKAMVPHLMTALGTWRWGS